MLVIFSSFLVRPPSARPTSHSSNQRPQQSQEPVDMKLHGQGLGATSSSQGVDVAILTNSGKPSRATAVVAPQDNLLLAASQAAPRSTLSNSKRMLPSQQEALKRIQESNKRNSMFVGGVQGAAAGATAAVQPTRKVLNYASFLNNNEA